MRCKKTNFKKNSMKLSISILALLMVSMISCDKKDDSPEQQLSDPNPYALSVGNSWKYQYFRRIDRTDEFESLDAFENVNIIDTSVINGNEYYTFETTTTGNNNYTCVPPNGTVITKFRDSLGYLIKENGLRYFSYSNPNKEYFIREETGDAKLYGMQTQNNENLEVTAGSFSCTVNEHYIRFSDGNKAPFTDYYFYSKEVGLVKSTCSFVSEPLSRIEKRLVSYNVKSN